MDAGSESQSKMQPVRQQRFPDIWASTAASVALVAGIVLGVLFLLERSLLQLWGASTTFIVGGGLVVIQVLAVFLVWRANRELKSSLSDAQRYIETLAQVGREEIDIRAELERHAAEQARLNELIGTLSTPLIPIAEDVVVVPLVGTIDANRLQHIRGNLLQDIQRQRARVAIIDLTGAVEFDVETAQQFGQVISGMELMGCRTVLTGISTQMARSLLEWRVDLRAESRRDLQAGIAYASQLLAK